MKLILQIALGIVTGFTLVMLISPLFAFLYSVYFYIMAFVGLAYSGVIIFTYSGFLIAGFFLFASWVIRMKH